MSKSKTGKFSKLSKVEPAKYVKPVGPGQFRMDGWQNLLTGLGDINRDKRMSANTLRYVLSYPDCAEIYRSGDMAARIVDRPVEEMLREGYQIKIDDSADEGRAIMQDHAKRDVAGLMLKCEQWARAYGGAGILVGADDGQRDLEKPLNRDNIRSIDYLTPLQSIELQGVEYYSDPLAPKFGETSMYRVVPQLASQGAKTAFLPLVHETRIIKFQGVHVSRRQLRENYGWGDSVFIRVIDVVRDFDQAWGGIANILQSFSQTLLKFNGLAEALAADDGSNALQTRLAAMDMARSMIRSIVVDKEDDFEQTQVQVSGLADLMDRFEKRLAAAADMPVTLLMGDAPRASLNSTGKGELEFWNKRVGNLQSKHIRPPLTELSELLMLAKDGPTNGVIPDNWSLEFNPLEELSQLEEAQLRFQNAQSDNLYVQMAAVSGAEIGESRFGGASYGTEIILDKATREGFDEAIDRKTENTIGEKDANLDPVTGKPVDEVLSAMRKTVIRTPKNKDGSSGGTTNGGEVASGPGGGVKKNNKKDPK